MATESVELAAAYIQLVPSLRGSEKVIAAELGGPRVSKVASASGRSIGSRLMGGLKTSAKVGAAGIATVLGVALTKGFKRLSSIENAEASLTGLGHSGKNVAKIMQNALKSVKGTAFGMDEAASTAAGAVAAGIKPGRELEKTLKLVTDAATIGKTSMGEMGAIFNKVATSNKIQADVMNQLNDRGIPIVQLLGKEMGVTGEEVMKLAKEGKIGFSTFQAAMEAGMGGAALKSGNTTTGALKNTGAALSRVGASLLKGVYPAIGLLANQTTKWLDWLNEKIGPVAELWGKELVGGIKAFGAAWTANDGDVTSSGLPGFMERAAYWIRQTVDAVRSLDFSSWQGFTQSLNSGKAGELLERAGSAMAKMVPSGHELSAMLTSVGSSLGTIGMGALSIVTRALEWLADNMDLVIKAIPYLLAGWAAWRVATLGLAYSSQKLQWVQAMMAPVLLTNNALRITAIFLENRQTAASGRLTAATNLQAAAVSRANIVTRLAAAGQWILNTAMRANPIGIIITAITLLVGALVWFFTQTEVGQKIIQYAWKGIQMAVGAVVNWFQTYVWPVLKTVFDAIGAVVAWLWNNIYKPYFGFIFSVIKAFAMLVRGIVQIIVSVIVNILVPAFVSFWKNTIQPVFRAAGDFIKTVWNNTVKPVFDAIRGFVVNILGPAFDRFYKGVIKPVWDWIGGIIRDVWNKKVKPVFDVLSKAIEKKVPAAFDTGVSMIKKFWDKIKEIARVPVDFVVNTIINKGLISNFNKIADILPGVDRLPDVAMPAGLARGGMVPGYEARKRDTVLTPMRPGEGVLVPEVMRALGSDWLYSLNAAGNRGGVDAVKRMFHPGRATGGMIHPVNNAIISSGYGPRAGYGTPGGFHDGIDFAAPTGTPVKAALAGRVMLAGWAPPAFAGGGNMVWLNHLNGLQTLYYHLNSVLTQTGADVRTGQTIGGLGSTGNSTGPHLHFTVRKNGQHVNPAGVLAGHMPDGETGGGMNPLDHLIGWVTDKIKEHFPAAGQFADMAIGTGMKLVKDAVDWVGNSIGSIVDNVKKFITGKGGPIVAPSTATVFDGGGWLHNTGGPQLVEHNKRKPDAVLSDAQWRLAEESLFGRGGDVWNLEFPAMPVDTAHQVADDVLYRMRRIKRGGKYAGMKG